MFLAVLLFSPLRYKCSEKWKLRSRGSQHDANRISPSGSCFYLLYSVPYLQYFRPRISWPRRPNLLKDFIRRMAWEKRFGFSQPKMKSKPTTDFSGTWISKRAKKLVSHPSFRASRLATFYFFLHLNLASDAENLLNSGFPLMTRGETPPHPPPFK